MGVMDLTVRDWMVIVGILLIMAVLLDAWRRVRSDRYSRVKVKLADPEGAVAEEERAVAEAADSSLDSAVKINISLTNLEHFSVVNEVMGQFLTAPFPARACVQVAALPKGAAIEIEAILAI